MIILPEYDANWHQKCTSFPLTREDRTTDLDTEIFVLVVGNPIHYGVQVEFWTNLTIFRCYDPSKIDNFAIFRFFQKIFYIFCSISGLKHLKPARLKSTQKEHICDQLK